MSIFDHFDPDIQNRRVGRASVNHFDEKNMLKKKMIHGCGNLESTY